MTSDTQIYFHRLHIIKYYLEKRKHEITVAQKCSLIGKFRTSFYKWFRRYRLYGEKGLCDIERTFPAMPNQIQLDFEYEQGMRAAQMYHPRRVPPVDHPLKIYSSVRG